MIITSRDNKIFKTAMLLKTSKGRNEKNMFLIEGLRLVRDAIKKDADIFCVILKDGTKMDFEVSCPVYTFAPKLFAQICDTVTPQGVIAVCNMKKCTLQELVQKKNSCIVMCEELQDPGNIGTIIRTAHAADCTGVVLTKGCCDLYNPKIVRATMSGIFSVGVVRDAQSLVTIEYFKELGYKIVAGALTDDAVDFYCADLKGKCVIVIGNEGNGVKRETLEACDSVLKIPMSNDAESLNAAVAGAVMIYEHYRQNEKNL